MRYALAPLFDAPALWVMGAIALAMLAVYAAGRRFGGSWAPLVLRVLAVAGIAVPGSTALRWYQDLARAREWSRDLPVVAEPIAERFMVNAAALLALGFFLLIGGIYLARRLPQQDPP